MTRLIGALMIVLVCLPAWADNAPDAAPAMAESGPKPKPIDPPDDADIAESIDRGVTFLVKRQNRDGSWGSARITRPNDIYAPVPGAHQAFQAAVTSLCVSALTETGADRPEAVEALERGEAWLLTHLPGVRRATPDAMYNAWTHAYGIQALVHMLGRKPNAAERCEQIHRLIDEQLELLDRYEVIDGGWAYYDFVAHTKKPSGSTMSFLTAAVLVSLYEAKQAGVDIPEKMVERAKASILRQRKPDFSYLYGEYLKWQPMAPVNRPGGSLGRSQACNVAMRLWGDAATTDAVIETWLDRLFARNLWLDIGRKRPVPHESWFQVAGYFFYFGHYYAARCIDVLPEDDREPFQGQLAHVLLRLQESDGSWWDFPMFDYHQQYGTAFAIMALQRTKKNNP